MNEEIKDLKRIRLENVYGETYYMTEEVSGNACSTEYKKIYLYSEDLGENYGDWYITATNDSQPNIWSPYRIKDGVLTIWEDRSKKYGYNFNIVE